MIAASASPEGVLPRRVAVVLVSYNAVSNRQIDRAVVARLNRIGDGRPFEAVIYDNGSSDGSAAALADWARGMAHVTVCAGAHRVALVEAIGRAAGPSAGDDLLLVDIDEAGEAERIEDLVAALDGYDAVHGVRRGRPPSLRAAQSGLFNRLWRWLGFALSDVGHHHFVVSRATFDRLRDTVERHRLLSYTFAVELLELRVREVETPWLAEGRSSYRWAARLARSAGLLVESLRVRRLLARRRRRPT